MESRQRENSKILGVSARTKRSQINFERHIYRIRIRIGTIYSGLSKVTSRTTMAKNKDKFDEGFQYDLGVLQLFYGCYLYTVFFHSCIFLRCDFPRIAFSTPAFADSPMHGTRPVRIGRLKPAFHDVDTDTDILARKSARVGRRDVGVSGESKSASWNAGFIPLQNYTPYNTKLVH